MNERTSINLYGAVTKVPAGRCGFNAKQQVRQGLDRLLFRMKGTHAIDYRNYVNPGTYNLGDHAIAIAVTQQIEAAAPDIDIHPIDWNALDEAAITGPTLVAGSGYYFIESSKTPAPRIARDSQFFEEHRCPLAFYGVGVNYVGKEANLALGDIPANAQHTLAGSLANASAISVRDATSQAILQPLTRTRVVVTGDPALFIKPSSLPRSPTMRTASQLTVGINIPFHGPAAGRRVARDLPAYIDFLKRFQRKHDCHFIQTIHFHSAVVIGRIMKDQGVRLSQAIGDVNTQLEAYQSMDFHIGGMLHSCILSASMGTPCVGLAYDIKHQGFFDLLGQPDLCIPAEPFDPERLAEACDRVLAQAQTIRSQLNSRRTELELVSHQFLTNTLRDLFH